MKISYAENDALFDIVRHQYDTGIISEWGLYKIYKSNIPYLSIIAFCIGLENSIRMILDNLDGSSSTLTKRVKNDENNNNRRRSGRRKRSK